MLELYIFPFREQHAVVFMQELLPHTFDYIARKLQSMYKPIIGTDDPGCEYLTATFLRLNTVYFEDYYIVPYPGSGESQIATSFLIISA